MGDGEMPQPRLPADQLERGEQSRARADEVGDQGDGARAEPVRDGPADRQQEQRGTIAQPSTRASADVEPVARSMASASAAGIAASPVRDSTRVLNSSRKSRPRSE
ncbi:hypothetical protein LUW76_27825 [Actinomadura madurae]|nr:hypothetical protein [Actinomadura madurae]URN01912.1 hypothetical protein LUW76_27825 [Actinomadura madurae]URN10929.1 hypothetical protein LUW74_37805 [Actinomadura madurae]